MADVRRPRRCWWPCPWPTTPTTPGSWPEPPGPGPHPGPGPKRGQDRLWAAFFQQSSTLIQDFSRSIPEACEKKNTEDRAAEREVALALLQSSHGLAAQEAPAPEAEAVRADLHAWLQGSSPWRTVHGPPAGRGTARVGQRPQPGG